MSDLFTFVEPFADQPPTLDEPILLLALDGWVDAGMAMSMVATQIRESAETTLVGQFDTDELLDHRARRPIMQLVNGLNTGLTWPSIDLYHVRDATGTDSLLLTGYEPDFRWRRFAQTVADLALDLGVTKAVTLGAYPSAVPHTRPIRMTSTGTDAELAALHPSAPPELEVPAGVHAALELACADVGIPGLGLWAQIPHYAAGMSFPPGALAILETLGTATGRRFDATSIMQDSASVLKRLDELIGQNAEHAQMVEQLEDLVDSSVPESELPSGDDLAADFQEFLRDQDE